MRAPAIELDRIDAHGPQHYEERFPLAEQDLEREEVIDAGEVRLVADAAPGGGKGDYEVTGTIDYTADLACSRCLEPFPFAISASFHLTYRARPEGMTVEEELELSENELDLEFCNGRSIPLRDIALEQVQLAIPMKPLCSESCSGLCPRCGTSLNRTPCACSDEISDDRWGALQEIREQLTRKSEQ